MTEQCVICLENMDDKKRLLLLDCEHTFHKECIDDWLNNSETCPTCRQNVNTDMNLALNRYMYKLHLVQYISIADILTSGVSMLVDIHGILFFTAAVWGFFGAFKLNIPCLIIYSISRISTLSFIGYKLGMYIKDDIKRMYDVIVIMYGIVCIFYIYIIYIIYILSRDMHKYKEKVLLLIN